MERVTPGGFLENANRFSCLQANSIAVDFIANARLGASGIDAAFFANHCGLNVA